MANLRIVYNNLLTQKLTLTASTEAGTLVASNLLTDIKSQVWRSTSTSANLTITWTNLQTIKAVLLPHTNLTNTATMRVRGYTNTGDVVGVASTVFDTTATLCCPYTASSDFGWDITPPNASNFGYIGGVYAGLFFTGGSVRKIYVELVDTSNANGYIECARLVTGDYWQPPYGAGRGIDFSYKDASAHTRNDSGDLLTDIKPKSKQITFSLLAFSTTDRQKLFKILRANGKITPIYISVFSGDTDKNIEQEYQLYAKLSDISKITLSTYSVYSTSITLEEV
jgi:hypothetical protein